MKKIVSVILVLSLCLSLMPILNIVADAEQENYKDLDLKLALVKFIGISVPENLSDNVTRGQMAEIATKFNKWSYMLVNDGNTYYVDVPKDIVYYSQIQKVTINGLMSGVGDKKFAPDDEISYTNAIKVFVLSLNANILASTNGGYPNGFLSAANTLGLTKGISTLNAEKLGWHDMIQLIYNGLNAKAMEPLNAGENFKFSQLSVLEDRFKIFKSYGLVTANEDNAFFGTYPNEGEIAIDDAIYIDFYSKVKDLLGFEVDFYYYLNDNDKLTVIGARKKDGSNKITLSSLDLESVSNDKIKYRISETENATIDLKIRFATLNGTPVSFNANLFDRENCEIDFIDCDGDEKFEVAIAHSYYNYCVDSVSETKIGDKFGREALIASDNDKIVSKIYKNGKQIKITDLKEWDIISIYTGSHGKKISNLIYVYDASVTGKYNETYSELGRTWFSIDNYPYLLDGYSQNPFHGVRMGDSTTVLLDYKKQIAGIKKIAISENYYLFLEDYYVTKTLSSPCLIEGVDNHSSKVILPLATKVRIFGNVFLSDGDYDNNIQKTVDSRFTDKETCGILARYIRENQQVALSAPANRIATPILKIKTNSSGNVNDITLVNVNFDRPVENGINVYNAFLTYTGGGLVWRPSTKSFAGNFAISNDTVVFGVQKFGDKLEIKSIGAGYFKGENVAHSVVPIDVNSVGVASMLVRVGDGMVGGSISADTSFFIVDRVVYGLDENGNTVKKLIGYKNYTPLAVNVSINDEDGIPSVWDRLTKKPSTIVDNGSYEIKQGTLLQLVADSLKNVVEGRVIEPPHIKAPTVATNGSLVYDDRVLLENNAGEQCFGYINAKLGNRITIQKVLSAVIPVNTTWNSTHTNERSYVVDKKAYLFDADGKHITIIDPSDIQVGWYAYIHATYSGVQEIYCYTNAPGGIN